MKYTMRYRVVFLVFLTTVFGFSDVLVMKNGKHFTIPGSFEVKGQFIRYRDAEDRLLQLPLKLVDLEASERATLEFNRKKEEKAVVVVPKLPKKQSLSEIADDLDNRRADDYIQPQNVRLDSNTMKQYESEDGENEVFSEELLSAERSGSDIMAIRAKVSAQYNLVADEISSLDKQIKATEDAIIGFRNESNFGDDFGGAAYKNIESFTAKRDEFIEQRNLKYENLQRLKREAGKYGDKSVARKRPVSKYKSSESDEDDLEYRSEKGEFDYSDDGN